MKNVNGYPASEPQIKLGLLFNGIVNYQIGYYCVDIYFPEHKVYLEYDGSGHDLAVREGYMSADDFERKEKNRKEFLQSLGLKELRIKNIYDKKLPSDNRLLKIRDFAFNYLGLDENQWLEIDLTSKLIITKYKILDLKEIY